ncbi:MAG: HD domain-containing protein [Candidatus Zambryskibacteria bacterium]|nr:HD domain-containing protein [Candidatus Zambryskibacteria bacterium]
MSNPDNKKIVQFLYEMGTMRKISRIHRQTFLTDDMTDNIATHSYRVALIGWFLAKMEGADPYKVVMMCLAHDMPEVRSNDHNWIHKRYVKIFEDEIKKEQLGSLPFDDLKIMIDEYDKKETLESIVTKEADMVDQIFLLREYVWQGNKEAQLWLEGYGGKEGRDKLDRFKTESARSLAEAAMAESPSSWWNNLATGTNR